METHGVAIQVKAANKYILSVLHVFRHFIKRNFS